MDIDIEIDDVLEESSEYIPEIKRSTTKLKAWKVMVGHTLFDTVYYVNMLDSVQVRRRLITEGYPREIEVIEE